jgi:hypothetical protein
LDVVRVIDTYRKHEDWAVEHKLPFYLPDARVVSYPRSGRSWVKFMCLHVKLALGLRNYENLVMFKHDGTRIDRQQKYLADKKRLYRGRDVILLARDPRDVVVSGWFLVSGRMQQKKYNANSDWTMSKWIRGDRGLPFCISWMNDWAEQVHVPHKFGIATYESFLKDPAKELKELLSWFGLEVDEGHCRRAAEIFTFANMQAHDKKCLIPDLERQLKTSFKKKGKARLAVREGQAGGYKQHLSKDDIAWMDEYIHENLSDIFKWYK